MLKRLIFASLSLAIIGTAAYASRPRPMESGPLIAAAAKPDAKTKTGKGLTPQQQRMKDCGAQWKAHKASTGAKGRDAWNAFRSECLKKKTRDA